jgi:hypothetical protein
MTRTAEMMTVDLLAMPASLDDFYGARAELVREVDRRQHALVMGWGGPPMCFSLSTNDNSSTYYLPLRVPPYCEWMRVAMIGSGRVAVILKTSFDTNGTALGWATLAIETARWVDGSNETGTTLDFTGRALKVAADSTSPAWSTCVVQLEQLGGTTSTGLRGIAFYPRFDTT